jgi:uncharacterized membrane-anchored protein YhcB (DUF1043 family)
MYSMRIFSTLQSRLALAAVVSAGSVLLPMLLTPAPAIAQLPARVNLDQVGNAEQQAIQLLRNNPELVLQLVQTTLAENPELVQYLLQNPQLVQQIADQSGDLLQELQQHPELLDQLMQLVQPRL